MQIKQQIQNNYLLLNQYIDLLLQKLDQVDQKQVVKVASKYFHNLLKLQRRKLYLKKLQKQFQAIPEIINNEQQFLISPKIVQKQKNIENLRHYYQSFKKKDEQLGQNIRSAMKHIKERETYLNKLKNESKSQNHKYIQLKNQIDSLSSQSKEKTPPKSVEIKFQLHKPNQTMQYSQIFKNKVLKSQVLSRINQIRNYSIQLKQLIHQGINYYLNPTKRQNIHGIQSVKLKRQPIFQQIGSSQLQQRQCKIFLKQSLSKIYEQKNFKKRKIPTVSFDKFCQFSGQEIFGLLTSNPELMRNFLNIFRDYDREAENIQRIKEIRNKNLDIQ